MKSTAIPPSCHGGTLGQNTTKLEAESFFETMEKNSGGKYAEKSYGSTRGGLADTLLSFWIALGGPSNRVQHCASVMRDLCANARAQGKEAMWHAHSQGAIVTWRALALLSPEDKAMLHG